MNGEKNKNKEKFFLVSWMKQKSQVQCFCWEFQITWMFILEEENVNVECICAFVDFSLFFPLYFAWWIFLTDILSTFCELVLENFISFYEIPKIQKMRLKLWKIFSFLNFNFFLHFLSVVKNFLTFFSLLLLITSSSMNNTLFFPHAAVAYSAGTCTSNERNHLHIFLSLSIFQIKSFIFVLDPCLTFWGFSIHVHTWDEANMCSIMLLWLSLYVQKYRHIEGVRCEGKHLARENIFFV